MTVDITLQKLPPQSIESEEEVLSACLMGAGEDAFEILVPEDCYIYWAASGVQANHCLKN